MTRVEQARQAGHGGVQGKLPADAQTVHWRHSRVEQGGRQIGLAQCNAPSCLPCATTPDGAVLRVAGIVIGDHGVGIVVAAIKKHADQRFVVVARRVEGGCLTHGGQVQCQGQGRARHGQLA